MGVQVDQAGNQHLVGQSNLPGRAITIGCVAEGQDVEDPAGGHGDGVIFDQLRNELFTASRGAGAMLNDKKIRVAEHKDITGSLLITGFPPRERARLVAQFDCVSSLLVDAEDIRRTGSAALDLAYVAAGFSDGTLLLPGHRPVFTGDVIRACGLAL